jgi:hypothetical protein
MRSEGGASRSRNALGMLACDIRHGKLIVEPTDPKLTATLNNLVDSTISADSFSSPVVKLTTAPFP